MAAAAGVSMTVRQARVGTVVAQGIGQVADVTTHRGGVETQKLHAPRPRPTRKAMGLGSR